MYRLIIFASLLLFGCVNNTTGTFGGLKETQISQVSAIDKYYGAWKGSLRSYSTGNTFLIDDEGIEDGYEEGFTGGKIFVLFLNCSNSPEIWLSEDEKTYQKLYEGYNVDYLNGILSMTIIATEEGWVETQTYSFVFIDNESGKLQRNRMVSNFVLDKNHKLRSFGFLDYGDIEKVSEDCNFFD